MLSYQTYVTFASMCYLLTLCCFINFCRLLTLCYLLTFYVIYAHYRCAYTIHQATQLSLSCLI